MVNTSTRAASRAESLLPTADRAATSTRRPDPLAAVDPDSAGGAGVVDASPAPTVSMVSEAGTESTPGVGALVRDGTDDVGCRCPGGRLPVDGLPFAVDVAGSVGRRPGRLDVDP
jgi:hypothetical protein